MEISKYLVMMEEESIQSCGREHHPAHAGGSGTTKAFFIDNLLRYARKKIGFTYWYGILCHYFRVREEESGTKIESRETPGTTVPLPPHPPTVIRPTPRANFKVRIA